MFAGYRMHRFCPQTNMVFQFRGCHWLGCPDCFQNGRKEVVAFEKTKQGKRKLTREMQYARTLKKKEFLRRVLNGSSVRSTTSIKGRFICKGKQKPFRTPLCPISRRCWVRANVRRGQKTCCLKTSKYRRLLRWQTL